MIHKSNFSVSLELRFVPELGSRDIEVLVEEWCLLSRRVSRPYDPNRLYLRLDTPVLEEEGLHVNLSPPSMDGPRSTTFLTESKPLTGINKSNVGFDYRVHVSSECRDMKLWTRNGCKVLLTFVEVTPPP